MKKLLLSLLCLLAVSASALAAETPVCETAFNKSVGTSSKNTSGYTDSWTFTNTSSNKVWNISNFHNNSWNWGNIRCGRKKIASTASIATNFTIPEKVNYASVNMQATSANVSELTSIKLYSSTDGNTWKEESSVTSEYPTSANDIILNIDTPTANQYYKVEFVCTSSASANGFVYVNSIAYYGSSDPEMLLTVIDEDANELNGNTLDLSNGDASIYAFLAKKDGPSASITPDSFNVTFSGTNASNFTYTSGSSVDEGTIKAINTTDPGLYTATATATATATGYQDATAEFTVSITIPDERPALTLGSVSDINITLPATGTFTAPTVTKADGTEITEGITWSFAYDPEGIVTIADDGKITGLKAGTTRVTATANVDGYAPASTSFNVTTTANILPGTYVFTPTAYTSSSGAFTGTTTLNNVTPDVIPVLTYTAAKGASSSNPPTYNTNNKDARIYAGGTFTITVPEEFKVTKIIFNLSSNGLSEKGTYSVVDKTGTLDYTGDPTWTYEEGLTNGSVTFKVDTKRLAFSSITYEVELNLPKMKINVTEPALDENNTFVFPAGTDNGIDHTPLTYTITDADGNAIESPYQAEITISEDPDHYNPANFFSYDNTMIRANIGAGKNPDTYSAPIKINVTKDGYAPASLQFDVKLTTHKSDLAIETASSFTEPTGEIKDEQIVMEIAAKDFDVQTSYKLNESRTINGLSLPASLQTWDYAIEPAEGLSIVYDNNAQKHILTATKKGNYSVKASVNTTRGEIFNAPATTDFTVTVIDNRKEMTVDEINDIEIKLPATASFSPVVKDGDTVLDNVVWTYSYDPEGYLTIAEDGSIAVDEVKLTKTTTVTVTAKAAIDGYIPVVKTFAITATPDPTAIRYYEDVLDKPFFSLTADNDTYVTKTGESSVSGVKYEANISPRLGQSKYSDNSVDGEDCYFGLRAKEHAGIVVTDNPNGLYFDHAVVTWGKFLDNPGATKTRTINVIYKKKDVDPEDLNSENPFTRADMYTSKCEIIGKGATRTEENPKGTQGTITYDFALNDDRHYIGFRTVENAVNVQSIKVVWTNQKPEVTPIVINEFTDAAVDHDALIAECDGTVENHKPNAYTLAADIADATNAEHLDKVDVTFQPAFTPAEWDETWNHAGYHHLFYGDPVLDTEKDGLQSDHFDFKAYVAGQYKMVFSIKDEYKKTHYLQNGDADHNVVRDFTLTPVLQDNVMKFYQNFVGNIQAAIYQDGKWSFTEYKDESGATVSSDLSHVMIHTGHGGELYYKVTYKDAPAAAPVRRGAAPAGYENYTRYDHNGINLSNASQLDLITNVNGAMSAPKSIIFSDTNVETGIDGIAAEKAEAEYYTIDGIRIDAPSAPGLYIVRRNGKGSVIRIRH